MSHDLLVADTRRFVHDTCARAIERYLPGLRVPRTFAGHRLATDFAASLCYVLKHLRLAGYTHVGQRSLAEVVSTILMQVDGESTETFYSYMIAETLQAFGGLTDASPVWQALDAKQRANLVNAVDSTHIYDPAAKSLRGLPNNYWGVLARCEFARQQLGLLADETLLHESLRRVSEILFANPLGFFDDGRELSGRFDIYSPDVHLFMEPLWPQLDPALLRRNLLAHTRLLETIALDGGAFVAWGRSVGALSVCLTAEFAAIALREKLTTAPDRMLALAGHALHHCQGWFGDDLIDAHRYRMTENYRGPYRLLQMTFNCLDKLAYAAASLAACELPPVAADRPAVPELFPARDVWIPFATGTQPPRQAGVWMFRNAVLAFQLAVVDAPNADYAPWLRAPGLFENPVDSTMVCGVPRIWIANAGEGESEYVGGGLPVAVHKSPDSLRLEYAGFPRLAGKAGPAVLPGRRIVEYKVVGDTVTITEEMYFDTLPSAVSISIPEMPHRPLQVQFDAPPGASTTIVNVRGMQFWRSAWGEIARVHQVDFEPSQSLRLVTRITPAVKVAHGPADHDYNRALYDRVPVGSVREIPFASGLCAQTMMNVERVFGDAEIIHLGWPEHLFSPHGLSEEEFDSRYAEFLGRLRACGKKIVWTLHNRRPHAWPRERGIALYQRVAPVVDACLHHSHWGKELATAEFPFRADCRHYVLPHMHFQAGMQIAATRQELERDFKLPPCAIRIGLLGRYQPEKQIEMILAAFIRAGRDDLQLVTTTYREDIPLPAHPQIVRLPRNPWMSRSDIAAHTKVCDLLIAAHTGDTYLTSGLCGDAVGVGLAMLVPEWPFFREIMADAALYHDNTPDGLTRAIAALTPAQVSQAKSKSVALQAAYDPARLAVQLAQILREVRLAAP